MGRAYRLTMTDLSRCCSSPLAKRSGDHPERAWPIKGFEAVQGGSGEAYEEAGVRWRIAGRAFGHYVYEKLLEGSVMPSVPG